MQEIVQAIQDEENKEKTRELYELENYDKKDLLKDIRKNHREERKKGKLYIEALQRDQEVSLGIVTYLSTLSLLTPTFLTLDYFHDKAPRSWFIMVELLLFFLF